MARLGLRLLGGFLLRADARARPLAMRKAQATLAYLALRAGRPHTRDALTGLLWDETREKQARQNLRQTMVRLRRGLAGTHRPALVVQGDTVALNPAEIEIDVVQFERLARRGTPEALDAAVALYHGPLLDGFRITAPAFEAWLDAERARLHDLVVDALRRVLARHVKAGRVEPATHAAARLVALDPLQEDVHRTLMRLYARQGRRAAALRQYQTCVAVQQKDLGVEPEPETKRLYLEILQRTVPPRGHGARAGAAAAARPAMSAADAPLIGRDAELERLRQRLRTAWRGRGHAVLVTGEPGIGKSRLVEELAVAATSEGGRVLFGRAHESEQILPFRPWMEALRTGRAIAQLAEDVTGRQQIRSDLARLFPELTAGEAPPPITADSYLRLFETIDALVADLAHVTPLVIILEDLHWADEMTLRLLSFVARHLDERPIVLLGTVREGEETPAWRRMTDELAALPHVEHLGLGALSKSATAALVRALGTGGGGDSRLTDVVAKVWTLSEGNPFVIVETMRALREGRLPDAPGVELPQRVRSDERWWLGQAMWALALHLLHVGDFGPGLELMERLRELGESMGERRLQAYAAWTAGRIHTVMGEAQAAIAATSRGLALAADPVARATSRGYLGAAYLEADDAAEAIPLLEESIAELQILSGTGGYRNQQIGSLLTAMLSEAYLLKGDVEHARELAARARAIVTGAGWAVALGYAERAAARVACTMGKLDDAEAAARHALETFAGCGAPAQVARSRLALAEILVARGDAAAATVELRTARDAFTQMRVPRLVERTERLAGTLGLGLDGATGI